MKNGVIQRLIYLHSCASKVAQMHAQRSGMGGVGEGVGGAVWGALKRESFISHVFPRPK